MSWPFRAEAATLAALSQQFTFPDTYLVLDCETTGFSKVRDFMIDAGWAVVKDRKIVHHEGLLLDWSQVPGVDHEFIKSQLAKQAIAYQKQGRPHYYPWERLCDEGHHPFEVLQTYMTLIYEHIIDADSMIVGHGLWRFDREVFDSHTQRFMQGYLLPWRSNSILDTGLLEKSAQMGQPPWVADTLDDWLRRTSNAHAKVKWNLEHHAVPKYRIAERYNLDMRLAHTASFDCILIHHLLDTFRQLMEILNGKKATLDGDS